MRSSSFACCGASNADARTPSGWIVLPSRPGPRTGRSDVIAEDRLLLDLGRERVDERKRLVVFVSKRTNGSAVQSESRRLSACMARRQRAASAIERDIDREVMAAELHHPSGGRRRRTENRDVILGAAKSDTTDDWRPGAARSSRS